MTRTWYATLGLLVAVMNSTGAPPVSAADPRVAVELLAGADAIAPGASVELALRFRVAEGWHIYWRDPGDAGKAPTVKWKLPPGFEVGPLRFPGPKRHREGGNLVTHVLDGSPVLTATLRAPPVLAAESVTLGAEVRWLVCKKVCVLESQTVERQLPVVTSADRMKPANEPVFRAAARTHPVPSDKAKYITVSASTSKSESGPGDDCDLKVTLSVKTGYHIQSHKPLTKGFIATDVFVDRPRGLKFGNAVFPPGEVRVDKIFGKMSEYTGQVDVRIPVTVPDDFDGDVRTISGVVLYQACDVKTCFPPQYVSWSAPIRIAGGKLARAAPPGAEAATVPESRTGAATEDRPAAPATAVPTEPPGGEPTAEHPSGDLGDARSGSAPGEPSAAAPAEEPSDEASATGEGLQGFLGRLGLPGLLFGCFVYGLFLNATPCVFPLLSIKVLGFVQQAHESRGRTLMLGLVFGAGVLVFFVILGFLAAAGKNVFQYPAAVIALGAIVLALALSMLGVYTLQVPAAAAKVEATIGQEGWLASFGKGTLAPVLGFACTGPLLAGAFGWATQQPPRIAVFAFLFAGLGMASPYVLLGGNPRWLSFLPRPGPWLITFERIMGFLLLAMVIWLLHPLIYHIGPEGLEWTLGFLVVIGMACWLLGRIDLGMSAWLRWRYRGGAIALVLGAGVLTYGGIYPLDEAKAAQKALRAELDALRSGSQFVGAGSSAKIRWRPWSADAVEKAVRAGNTVFVDFTAAYCTICKTNKAVAINTPEVQARMRELGVVAFTGDFTDGDPAIFAMLKKHRRLGVPLNLIYPPGKPDAPIVLRPNLTKQYLLDKLDEAGPSSPGSVSSPALPHHSGFWLAHSRKDSRATAPQATASLSSSASAGTGSDVSSSSAVITMLFSSSSSLLWRPCAMKA